jgi:hypothetical protein
MNRMHHMKNIIKHNSSTSPNEFYYFEDTYNGEHIFVCSFNPSFEDFWIVDNLETDVPLDIDYEIDY